MHARDRLVRAHRAADWSVRSSAMDHDRGASVARSDREYEDLMNAAYARSD